MKIERSEKEAQRTIERVDEISVGATINCHRCQTFLGWKCLEGVKLASGHIVRFPVGYNATFGITVQCVAPCTMNIRIKAVDKENRKR